MASGGQFITILDSLDTLNKSLDEQNRNKTLEDEGFKTEDEKKEGAALFETFEKLNKSVSKFGDEIDAINSEFPDVSKFEKIIDKFDERIKNINSDIISLNDDIIKYDKIINDTSKPKADRDAALLKKQQAEDDLKNKNKELRRIKSKKDKYINKDENKEISRVYSNKKNLEQKKKDAENELRLMTREYANKHGGKDLASVVSTFFSKNKQNSKLGKAVSNAKNYKMNHPIFAAATEIGKFVLDTFAKVLTFMTEYAKKENENFIRGLNATTDVAVNTQKIALASWVDAVNGAYEAQSAMIENLKTLTDATVENELANKRFTASVVNASMAFAESIPFIGDIVGMFTATTKAAFERDIAFLEMEGKVFQAQMNNAQKVVNSVKGFTTKTDEYLKKQDNAIKNYGRSVMMSVNQIDLFEERLLGVGTTFAEIGRTIEDALKIQGAVTEKTGREVNYSNEDFTKSLATANIVGDDNLIQFQSEMHIFNKSVGDSADIMFETTRDIAKMGLSTKKVTSSILNNLKLANKYSFKNGTKGLIELSKWAENVRFNLTNLGSMLEKVQTGGLEGTITQAARLQVLGGRFAMGADPLAMLYEAHEDPDAYAKRMHTMIKGMGSVNKETGETVFNMSEQRMLRAYADAAGMSYEDALTMAREDNKKEVVSRQMKNTGLSKEQISAVANKAQRDSETGRWYVNTISGGRIDVSDVNSSTDLEQILSNDKTEQSLQYAKETLSVEQEIKANTDYISALLGGESFLNFRETASKSIAESRKHYEENLAEYVKATEGFRNRSVEDQEKMLSKMTDIATKYDESLSKMDEIERLMEERIGIMVDVYNLEKEKRDKESAESAYAAERKKLWKEYENVNEQYRAVDEDKEPLRKQELKLQNDNAYYAWRKVANGKLDWMEENYPKKKKETLEMNDGIVSAKNKPMSVVATDVVPIQDGKVKLAKTDPKDSAIFAKNGGPFDTLFNDIFGKINEVYKDVSGRHEIEAGSVPSSSETTNNQYSTNVVSKAVERSISLNNGTLLNNTYNTSTSSNANTDESVINEGNILNNIYRNSSVSKVNEENVTNSITNDFSQVLNKILNDNHSYNTEYSTILNDILNDSKSYTESNSRYSSVNESKKYDNTENNVDNRSYVSKQHSTVEEKTSNVSYDTDNKVDMRSYMSKPHNTVEENTSNVSYNTDKVVNKPISYNGRTYNTSNVVDSSTVSTKNYNASRNTNVSSNLYETSEPYKNRIYETIQKMGSVDSVTGKKTYNMSEQRIIKSYAETLGISYDDAIAMVEKPQAPTKQNTPSNKSVSNVSNTFNSDSSIVRNDVYGDTINSVLNRLFNSDKTFNDYGDTFGGRNVRSEETISNALSNIYNDTFERKSENNTFNDNATSVSKAEGKDVTELILNKVEGNEERSYAEKPLTMLYDSRKEPQSVLKHTGDVFSNVSDKTTAMGESALTTNQNTNTTVTNNGQYNVSISGNIKLDAGNKTFDISKELETNPFLVRQITQLISENISKSMNGGKAENAGIMNLNVFRK